MSKIGFIVTDFHGRYPVGTCAFVVAEDREHCKRLLKSECLKAGLPEGGGNPDDWTIEPVTPLPRKYVAKIILDGNY